MAKRMTDLEVAITMQMADTIKDKKGKKQECTGVCLQSLDSVGNVKDEIYTRPFDGHPMTPEEVTETIQRRADVYASGHEDRVHFEVGFFFGDDRLQRPYRFFIDSPTSAGAQGNQEATAKGLVKDAMRNMNTALSIAFDQTRAMAEASTRTIDRLSSSLERMAEKHEEKSEQLDAAIGVLINMKHAAEDKSHEHRMKELEKEKTSLLWKKAIELLPAGINALAGKGVLPSGDKTILLALGEALQKKPQLAGELFGLLREEAQGLVADRMMQLEAEQAQEAAERKRAEDLANGVPMPSELGGHNAAH